MQLCPETVLRETKFLYRNSHSTFICRRQYSAEDFFRDAANSQPQFSDRMIYGNFPARKALSKTNTNLIYYLLGLYISSLCPHWVYTDIHTNIFWYFKCRHMYIIYIHICTCIHTHL